MKVQLSRKRELGKDGVIRNMITGKTYSGTKTVAGYPMIKINGRKQYVHRVMWESFVGPIPEGMTIDHIDGNKSNNSLSNLRLATHGENNRAYKRQSSGYRGVSWSNVAKKWHARLSRRLNPMHLGYFNSKAAAALAYDSAALANGYFKEALNFPQFATAHTLTT